MASPPEAAATAGPQPQAVDVSVRALGIALVGSLLGFYIITGMPQLRLNVFGPTVTLHLVTTALVLIYVTYLVLYRRLPGGTPIDRPVALLVVAYALATAFSINYRVSLENMLQVLMAVVVLYALSDIRILSARDLQRGLMLAGGAASIYALWVVGHDYADWLALAHAVRGFSFTDLFPPTVPRVHDVSDHPNILAMVLVLVVPFYALAIYRPEGWWERAGGAAGLLVAVIALFLTLSRGAWIGALVAVGVTAAGMTVLAMRDRGARLSLAAAAAWLRGHRAAVIAAGAALAVVVVLGAVAVGVLWDTRPEWLFRGSVSPRYDVFNAGVEMFADRPLLGSGPNTYALLYAEYSGKYPVHGVHSHNAYLQAAVDLGIPGVLALLALGATLGWMLWQVVRRGAPYQRLLAVTTGSAILGFLVHGLVDAPNGWKAPVVALAAVGAVAIASFRESAGSDAPRAEGPPAGDTEGKRAPARLRRAAALAPRLMVLAVIAVLVAGWTRSDLAHAYYARSLTRAIEGRLPEAVSDGSRAADLDPGMAIYWLQLGLTELRSYEAGGPPSTLGDAIEHLRRAVREEPRGAIAYLNLARALDLDGRSEEARATALEALRRAGRDEAVLLATGTVLESTGAADDAIDAYAAAVALNTGLADSPFWATSRFRQENYTEVLRRTPLVFNPCRFGSLLARSSGDLPVDPGTDLPALADACAARVAASPNEIVHRVELGDMLLALGEDEEAGRHLRFAVDRRPDNAPARTALGRWYAQQGDLEAARREWLLASQLEDPEAALILGDSYPAGEVPEEVIRRLGELMPKAGSAVQHDIVSVLYYRMKFSRGAPVIIIFPGEWQQAVPNQYVKMRDALIRWRNAAASSR